MEDAKSILARWGEMEAARTPWEGSWQMAANYAVPRKGNLATNEAGPGSNPANRLYDVTAIEAVNVLSNGHASEITPAGTRWATWEAPDDIKSDKADAWYNGKSELALKILASTNFYTTLGEAYFDRVGFGLCNIAAFPSAKNFITFQAHPVKTYCVDEDAEGNVDTVFLQKVLGIRQLEQMFGEAAILKSEKLAASWTKFKEKGTNSKHTVIHAVFPRVKRTRGKADIFNMPYASVWVETEGKTVIERSGLQELPYCVSRYLKRSGCDQVYGYGPVEEVKAAVLEANRTRQILNVVGQRIAVPSLLLPDDLVGNVDTRPGGKTVFKSGGSNLPQEWLTKGRPDGLLEQLQDCRDTINQAFHVDLFRMFAQIERQMTAREVAERSSEKLMQFSPTFTRFMADFEVMMVRIFNILFRAGVFGAPQDLPPEVLRRTERGIELPPPKVVYQSRIALAIRQAETAASDRLLERVIASAGLAPDALDNINLDEYLRMSARNDGVPEKVLRPEADMLQMREDRLKAQQEAQQKAEVAAMAEGAAKLGMKL